jgi:phenylalanyl-tRNA synthetase beta chain
MEVSLNWIRKYVELDADVDALSKALTSLGFEVEACRTQGAGLTNVVAAEVMECERHPEADKLSVCKVFDGTETFPVVCGAPNVAKGQRVLLAKVGAELPGKAPGEPGLKIKKAKLRGQESHGMICAEDELGLGESHDGILVLDPSVPNGTPLDRIPGLCDTLFEINVTPNRPDALCHVGVARELAAKFGKPLRYPTARLREEGPDASGLAEVVLDDKLGCTLYTGRIIQGVKVGPSPDWLVKALKSLGKRSINNVVDLTNYVLLELGQPSHAFDFDKISGGKVVIRRAEPGEKLLTLDDVERTLTAEDMVIADAKGPMVLAGVMGGKSTEVDAGTTNVFLEVAYFNASTVRRQGRRHGLSSDSSYRFERGIDPLNTSFVSDYLAGLIAETCGGRVAKGRIAQSSPEHPHAPRVVYLRPTRAQKLLGVPVASEEAVRRLQSIDLKQQGKSVVHGDEALAFAIPGFRGDLEREADLIEEVARLGDYNNIPAVLPSLPIGYQALPPSESLSKTLRHFLRDAGLNETLNLRFSSRKSLAKLGLAAEDPRQAFVPLRNPISEEWETLPTTTLPALLQAVAYNQNNQERDCRFFEIAKAFYHKPAERSDRAPGVWEEEVLYLALGGEWPDRRPWTAEAAKATESAPVEFYHLKGLLENLLRAAGVNARFAFPGTEPYLHPSESGTILANLGPAPTGAEVLQGWRRGAGSQKSARIGSFGILHPRAQSKFELKGPILVAEISLSGLLAAERRSLQFSPFGQFSGTSRDLNLVVDDARKHGEILEKMPIGRIPNLQEVRLNSVYRGPGVPEGKKALHYSFLYRHAEKTLTDEEVNKAQEKLNQELAKDASIIFK